MQISTSRGGVPKLPILQGVIDATGVHGDRQKERLIHGGPNRALCLYAQERIDALVHEGHPIQAGSTGENVTLAGVDWDQVTPGARLRLGPSVLVEITDYAQPCKKIRPYFADGDFHCIDQKRRPGWSRVYARVLCSGVIQAGDAAALLPAGGSE